MSAQHKRSALGVNNDDNVGTPSEKRKKKVGRKSSSNNFKFPENIFTLFISKAGMTLNICGNKLSCDPVTFCKKLDELIESHADDVSETVEALDSGLEETIENEKVFICLLMPTELTAAPEDVDIMSSQMASNVQDGVVKILLQSDNLQGVVINALLKKLPLYAETENVKVDASFGMTGNSGADIVNVPRLILNQLRWLDLFKDSVSVAHQLIELASIMKPGVACDIICFIPDLLADDGDHAVVAIGLCDLLNNGPENITSAIFEALSNLVLDDNVTKDVYDLAASFLSTASHEDMPVIIKYLLKSCNSIDSAKEIITMLHPHLDFSVLMLSADKEKEKSIKSSISLIADTIFSALQFQDYLATAWLNVLEKTRSAEVHIGDVITLLLLCDLHNSKHRKMAVNIMQTKLKKGTFPKPKVQQTIELCPDVISSHFKSVSKQAQSMVWHANPSLRTAGAFLYRLFLLNMDSYCQQETIGLLVTHIGSMSTAPSSETDTALDVLCSIAQSKPIVLSAYINFLRDALDRMDLMTLSQVRKSYRILSLMAFSNANDTTSLGLRDEIHMMLQKQLTHILDKFRRIGIIGSVTALVAMSNVKHSSMSQQKNQLQSLMETLNYVLKNDIHGWSMFFDEIYLLFSDSQTFGQASESFQTYINKDAQNKLQQRFLTEYNGSSSSASSSRLLDVSYRFGLLTPEEQKETGVAIQLTSLLLNSQNRYIPGLLCSLVRAISAVLSTSTGSLADIDALLSCPVLLHDVKYEEKLIFKELSSESATCVLDSLIALYNWFRELVSVFCLEKDPDTEIGVLVRWKQICDLQNMIEMLLPVAPNGYSAVCTRSSHVDGQTGVSSFQKNQPQNTSKFNVDENSPNLKSHNVSISSTACTAKPVKVKKDKKSTQSSQLNVNLLSSVFRPVLHELSYDVFMLLEHPLQCTKQPHEELESNSSNEEKFLRPQHLLALLIDLNDKLNHRLSKKLPFGFGHQANTDVGFENFIRIPIKEVISKVVSLVPYLCRHLEDIHSYFQKDSVERSSQDSNDSVHSDHSANFVKQHDHLTHCYAFLLEILCHIFSWPEMDDDCNKDVYGLLLKHLSSRLSENTQKADETLMLSTSFRYLANFSKTIPSCQSAQMLIKLLIALYDFADCNKSQQGWMSKKISITCGGFLSCEWSFSTTSNGSQKQPLSLSAIFHAHLKYSEDPLDSLEKFLRNGIKQLLDKADDEEENTSTSSTRIQYPCLTKSNFSVFYKCMMETLAAQAAEVSPPSKTSNQREDNIDLLLKWSEIVKLLDLLIKVLKSFSSRSMLSPALKYARATVESFLRNGILMCEVTFREHQDDVISLLKKVQLSTRQLQHLACHSKISKDSSLTNHVPALKRCLETFLFRVKALLVLHNCHEAFWLGNLKNRNLQGEELLSQAPPSESEDEDDEASEARESHAEDESHQSYSECY
ncbi:unnamed protein product [Clavelina lepadiformis]|uniref:Fanconi anemia group D2 protein n=1 Tax=Clavelina lepadiformis TaxID=159417 RepID=A0ABP0FAM2_CLALP